MDINQKKKEVQDTLVELRFELEDTPEDEVDTRASILNEIQIYEALVGGLQSNLDIENRHNRQLYPFLNNQPTLCFPHAQEVETLPPPTYTVGKGYTLERAQTILPTVDNLKRWSDFAATYAKEK